jgi:prepilin-type N-terminal cleavage/methylation domain-containing protein
MQKNRRGFSLVELAIGLAVVTVLILAISVSAGIRDNARVQSAANSVQTLRTAAENYLAAGKLNYSTITIDALRTAKFLPNGFTGSKANPWGGHFGIVPNEADNARYDVILSTVAKADAEKLTTYFNNSASLTSYDEAKGTWSATF